MTTKKLLSDATPSSTKSVLHEAVKSVKMPSKAMQHKWRMQGLKLPATTSSKACARCPGYCCRVFGLRFTMKTLREDLVKALAAVKECEARPRPRSKVDRVYEAAILERHRRQVADTQFALDHFHRVKTPPLTKAERKDDCAFFHGGRPQRYFTCDQYDKRRRRCKAYASRPAVCSAYICDEAAKGEVPPAWKMFGGMTAASSKIRRAKYKAGMARVKEARKSCAKASPVAIS